jgi:hypothetical protein
VLFQAVPRAEMEVIVGQPLEFGAISVCLIDCPNVSHPKSARLTAIMVLFVKLFNNMAVATLKRAKSGSIIVQTCL